MKRITRAIGVATLLVLAASVARAGDIVGYTAMLVPANADVRVGVPFNRDVAGTYTVDVVTVAENKFTVDESITAGTYGSSYYVRFVDGGAAGRWATVDNTDTADMIVLTDSTMLSSVAKGNKVEVYPHQTLASVFPDELLDVSFEASIKHATLPFIETYTTQVLVFTGASDGINKSATDTYYYYDGAWREVGKALTESYDDVALDPRSTVLIRNLNEDGELVYVPNGNVPTGSLAMEVTNGVDNDILTTTGRPTPVTLDQLNLGGTDAFVDSQKHPTLPFIQTYGDTVLVFDNGSGSQNHSAVDTYFYYNGGWRKVGQALTSDFGSTQLDETDGFIIRKTDELGSGSAIWTAVTPY